MQINDNWWLCRSSDARDFWLLLHTLLFLSFSFLIWNLFCSCCPFSWLLVFSDSICHPYADRVRISILGWTSPLNSTLLYPITYFTSQLGCLTLRIVFDTYQYGVSTGRYLCHFSEHHHHAPDCSSWKPRSLLMSPFSSWSSSGATPSESVLLRYTVFIFIVTTLIHTQDHLTPGWLQTSSNYRPFNTAMQPGFRIELPGFKPWFYHFKLYDLAWPLCLYWFI